MRPLAMYVPEPGRGSSVPIDLFTAFALTQPFPVFATGVPVGPVFLLGLLVPAIVAACASRAAVTLSATYFLMAA
ncbi:hypothetical protein Tco_1343912 [Tanacetum coccineum]